eukprot:scaffold1717_cov377-Prasinococcus_capsulatus_cf.AAC.1
MTPTEEGHPPPLAPSLCSAGRDLCAACVGGFHSCGGVCAALERQPGSNATARSQGGTGTLRRGCVRQECRRSELVEARRGGCWALSGGPQARPPTRRPGGDGLRRLAPFPAQCKCARQPEMGKAGRPAKAAAPRPGRAPPAAAVRPEAPRAPLRRAGAALPCPALPCPALRVYGGRRGHGAGPFPSHPRGGLCAASGRPWCVCCGGWR